MKRLCSMVLLAVAGCKKPSSGGETTSPSDSAAVAENPFAQAEDGDGKPLPTTKDRDPEKERQQLEASRTKSAQARQLLAAGRHGEAVDMSREALRVHEQNVDAMLVIAQVFYLQGKYEITQVITANALTIDAAVRTKAETSGAHNLMGFALLAMGKDSMATQAFKKAAESDDKNAEAWNNLGARYLRAGDSKTALTCFKYALELEPKFANAHLNLGAAHREQGKWVEAEKAFQRALQLRPNSAAAFFNLGVLYLDADPFPGLETIARYNKAIANLTKYRELAAVAPPKPKTFKSLGPSSTELAPVSPQRADDYIRIAKKGIAREERRIEREKKAAAKAAAGEKSEEAGAEESEDSSEGAT